MIPKLRHLVFLVAFIFAALSKAQTYPVQAFVQIAPPFTSYLPDYSDPFNNQMKVLLTLTDFTIPSYQVKLRFTFEGNGYTITTSSLLSLPVTTLTPGVPIEISGSDLAPYFNSANLIFSGIDVADYELRKVLPEGPCSICVEVVDFSNPNQSVLANTACSQVWFSLNDPPLLNTPFCGNVITPTDPQQVIFSWTPLHMNSVNSLGTQYVFELFEIRPEGADPNQVVNSTLPIFMQVTDQTYINYGIVEPQLQTGMEYVWRVKAQDIAGRDIFRNNGYSLVCTFTYGNIAASLADGIVLQLNSNGTGVRQGLAWWNASSTFTHYKLEVRKTGNDAYEWFPYTATAGDTKINSLEPSTQYECRVKGLINEEYESEWSNISVFTTQPAPDYACASTTLPAKQQVITPLTNAISGMYFTVGQFEMMVTDIEPVDDILFPGHYKGTGKINIGFALINLRVKFDDILVDENLMVRSGKVEAITEGIGAWENSLTEPDYFVDGTIDNFVWNDSTSLTVWVDGVPQTFEFDDDGTIIIQDEEGSTYTFNADGTYTVISILVYSSDKLAATKDFRIDFSADPNQKYGFDKKQYSAWIDKYEVIKLDDATNYFVSYKSLAPGESDFVIANVTSTQTLNNLTFIASGSGSVFSSEKLNDTTYRVSISNLNESDFIYVWSTGQKIGKLWVKVLPLIEKEIVIVPVNGSSLTNISAIEENLNKIYAQANVKFNVTLAENYQNADWDLNADGKLQNGDSELMTNYSEEMRGLRDNYFETHPDYNNEAYHLFVVSTFSDDDLAGYMVRGKGVGFLKNGEDANTAAHELAHGIFALEHTFPEVAEGTTDNLMDYTSTTLSSGSEGGHLAQHQWYRMHEVLPAFSFLDGEEDGSSIEISGTIPTALRNPDGSMTFISPGGFPITLPPNAENIELFTLDPLFKAENYYSAGPIGTLLAFSIETNGVVKNYRFKGKSGGIFYSTETDLDYVDSYTYTIKPSKVILGFPFYQGDFLVQLYYLDLATTVFYTSISENYASNTGADISNFKIGGENYIDLFSAVEIIFGVSEVASDNQNIIYNELGEAEWVRSPSALNWESFFTKTPNAVLSCSIDPVPSQVGMQYINDNKQFTSQGNPLGAIIISNAVWITYMQHSGMNSFFECYVDGDPLGNYLACDQLLRELNIEPGELQDAQAPYYDFSLQGQAFKFYERLQAEIILFEKVNEQAGDINEQIASLDYTDGNQDDAFVNVLVQILELNECALAKLTNENRIKCLDILNRVVITDGEQALAVKLVRTTPTIKIDDFLTLLNAAINNPDEVLGETSILYQYLDELDGEHYSDFVSEVYELWKQSKYYNFDYGEFSYATPSCYYSPDGNRYVLDYQSEEGFMGFFNSNFDVSRQNRIISIEEEGVGNCQQNFSAFQPIGLLSVNQEGVMSMPAYGVPAFFLYAFENGSGDANTILASKITFDVLLTFTGVGNLAKLRYLSAVNKLSLGQKASIVIGGVEFTSGMAAVVLEYTCDDASEWCNEIKNILFMIELASLGTDALLTQLIKIRCKRVINDNLMPEDVPGDLENIINKYADETVINLTGISVVDDFLKQSPKINNISSSELPAGYEIMVLNESKYIRRLDASNLNTPRLMVDETGTIVKYNRPLRANNQPLFISNLKTIYGPMPLNHQRHHLVPVNVTQSSPLHQEAISRGLYYVDRGSNGRYLAETDEDYIIDQSGLSSQYPTHLGSHPNYDQAIRDMIDDVLSYKGIDINNLSNLSDQEIIDLLNDIEDQALGILEDWIPAKVN